MKALPVFVTAAVLAGCSSDSSSPVPELIVQDPIPEPVQEVPDIVGARPLSGPLEQKGAASFGRYLKNGMYSATDLGLAGLPLETDNLAITTTAATESFSSTNTQEAGVDEADRIEYTGTHLYLATYPEWFSPEPTPSEVKIYERQGDDSLSQVAAVSMGESSQAIAGIYQHQNSLTTISASSPIIPLDAITIQPWLPFAKRIGVSIFDVSTPATPTNTAELEIDGWLIASRRIDNQLYLVTSFTPSIEGLETGAEDDESKLKNYSQIQETPTSDLMPKIYQGELGTALNAPEDCYIPSTANELDGYGQILSVIRINLTNPDDRGSLCMSALADVAYVSPENLFLASSPDGNNTVVHKISLNQDVSYQATGEVSGILGWNANPQLRLSEQNGFLRMVTTQGIFGEDPEHQLHVLSQQDDQLVSVATLPNEAQPEAIGKPGENIFAVRYLDDKAYIVTFERIDPLYVIDLSDPQAPFIQGSLEIPGFSSYLQPIGDNLLLGIGQEVEAGTSDPNRPLPVEPVRSTGMKVSLFDVSNPEAPTELASIVKESSYTPVEFDYKALSTVQVGGISRFALPLESWQTPDGDNPGITLWDPDFSLLMLEVDSGSGLLSEVGELQVETGPDSYVFGGNDRSVLHDDRVYYIHGNQVWFSTWGASEPNSGPF